jgi:hypothetical protein
MSNIPANIKVAAILSDRLFNSGLVAETTAQYLFDVLSDALSPHVPLCQIVCTEIEFAVEAYTSPREEAI